MRFEKNDFILPGESLPLELSRGCIFKCRFCQYPNIGKDKDDLELELIDFGLEDIILDEEHNQFIIQTQFALWHPTEISSHF